MVVAAAPGQEDRRPEALQLQLPPGPRLGKTVLEGRKISKSLGGKVLFRDVRILDSTGADPYPGDVLVTDIWVSLGQEAERATRMRDLEPYRLDEALLLGSHQRRMVLVRLILFCSCMMP